jgi:hypothetical protein
MDFKKYYNSTWQEYYESEYWITVEWNLRWWAIFDTYEWKIFISDSRIIWLEFEKFYIWNTTKEYYPIWIWNIVKYILENKKYLSEEEFLKELNILYKNKIEKIIK